MDWAPVVTRFKSSSRISTTTSESNVRSLAAVVAPDRESDTAAPWLSLMVWLVAVNPEEVNVRV